MSVLRLLTEAHKQDGDWQKYCLREIIVNPNHVVLIREDALLKQKMISVDNWPDGLDDRAVFCRIHLNSGSGLTAISVVGDLQVIAQKLEL